MSTPTRNRLRGFQFCALAGVEGVSLDGEDLVGRWKTEPTEYYGPKPGQLVESFVNWASDTNGVLRFTKRYGPLEARPQAGQEFRYPMIAWVVAQRHFRWLWETARGVRISVSIPELGNELKLGPWRRWELPGEQIARLWGQDGYLVCQTTTLYMFLYLDICTFPRERLRKCARPDCHSPYFIASHLGQAYCSDRCAAWAQSKWKREWWTKHGKRWRMTRRKPKARRRR